MELRWKHRNYIGVFGRYHERETNSYSAVESSREAYRAIVTVIPPQGNTAQGGMPWEII